MTAESTPVDPDPFHLLTVREGHEWPELHAFPNLDDLVAFLKQVRSSLAIRAYIFRGHRLRISKGPYRYLLNEKEEPIPLFDVELCDEPDPNDYLWEEPAVEPNPGFEEFLREQLEEEKRRQPPKPEQRDRAGEGESPEPTA
jgi:hypothetical protein